MRNAPTNSLIEHLRLTVLPPDESGVGDGELLGRFVERHDEAAFAALVNRHGPMVWGVCRRLLNRHDAEDAFQATFLVLARKAVSVRSRQTVGNWLYGVAHQTALQARRTATRRRAKEVQVTTMPDTEAVEPDPWADLQPLLDEELSRLPDIYRAVIVLCDLEGRTRKEVARRLGVPEGTVAGRISRARTLLARRLTRRGVALSGGALAAVLTQQGATAGMPISVVVPTIKAARLVAARRAATGAVSVQVAALTEGVMKAMLFNKLKAAMAVVLMLGFVATGATLLTDRTAAGQDDKKPVAEKPVEPAVKQEKEAFTAWGKEAGGLQAGVGFLAGQKRIYRHGETVTLVVRVRNVGKEEVTFQYVPAFFKENPATVTDTEGKPVTLLGISPGGRTHPSADVTLAPGKEVDLYEWKAALRPASESKNPNFEIIYGTGKFNIQYERVLGKTTASARNLKFDPALSKLATGKLELEVRSDPPPAGDKRGVLTPEEAVRIKNAVPKATVEFKVEHVTKSILVKTGGDTDAGWVTGHGPDDLCLRPQPVGEKRQAVFEAILTDKAIKQLNRAGVKDVAKHFKSKTVRVTGQLSREHYDGLGTPPVVEVVIDDLGQIEVVD